MGLRVPRSMRAGCVFSSCMSPGTSYNWPGIGIEPAHPAERSRSLHQITPLSVFGQESMPVMVWVKLVLVDLICIVKLYHSTSTLSLHTKHCQPLSLLV